MNVEVLYLYQPTLGLAVGSHTHSFDGRARMRAPVLPSSRLLREALREVHDVDRVRDR